MENKRIGAQIINFFLYIFVHILFTKELVLYNTAFCYCYVAFLLLLPSNIPRTLALFIGFTTGLFIDMFYDSIGMNAAACVAITYIRPYLIKALSGKYSFENSNVISIHSTGFQWFFVYAGTLLLVHHSILFLIDTASSQFIFYSLNKAFFSSLFSLATIILLQYLVGANTQRSR